MSIEESNFSACLKYLFMYFKFKFVYKNKIKNGKLLREVFENNRSFKKIEHNKENSGIQFNSQKVPLVFNKDFLTYDSLGLSFGLCCLQVTYSSRNIHEARKVTDQMSVLAGPIIALTASMAVFDSVLVDWDARYRVLEESVDDRNRQEYVTKPDLMFIERYILAYEYYFFEEI